MSFQETKEKISLIKKEVLSNIDTIVDVKFNVHNLLQTCESFTLADIPRQLQLYNEALTQKLVVLDNLIDPDLSNFYGTDEELHKIKQTRKRCVKSIEDHASEVDQLTDCVKRLMIILKELESLVAV